MASAVLDPAKAEALDLIAAGVDALLDAGMEPFDSRDAKTLIHELERQCRRLRSSQVDLLRAIDQRSLHRPDGHVSAKVMLRHEANVSNAEAERRSKSSTALQDLPLVRAAFGAGRIGGCQVERIAAAHANPRVRTAVIANDAAFAAQGEAVGYRLFHLMVTNWVNEVDQDGPRDRNERCHDNRDFKMVADFDGTWVFNGGCASLQGTQMQEIFKHFYEAETLADWEKARAEHGDSATVSDLARTDAQRRSDASLEIFRRAAADNAVTGGSPIVTNIVIDHGSFERLIAQFFGTTPGSDPDQPEPATATFGDPLDRYRCSTLDGRPVDPTEAVAHALYGQVRRAVIGADSVVIDLARRRRLFSGPAALAVRLANTTCYWPGCHAPVSGCQIDHLSPWAKHGGSTNPGNGGPACGRHNRLKEQGFPVWRDQSGHWHVTRPDGTPID